MLILKSKLNILSLIFCIGTFSAAAIAQTTAFTYQGSLSEAGNPVTGTRFFRFTLFDENGAPMPGATLDQTLTVTNGVFTTSLDFGASVFPGANRSLEIAVKVNAGDPFTILHPLQPIRAVPYSIRSKEASNATQLGGVESSRFVQQDAGGNVSIAGDFSVNGALSLNTVNAQTQFSLGGQRILSNAGSNNIFAGVGAGTANTTGDRNSFFGTNAGQANTTGAGNLFVGESAGRVNLQVVSTRSLVRVRGEATRRATKTLSSAIVPDEATQRVSLMFSLERMPASATRRAIITRSLAGMPD
jgi:hypothetical protein